MYHYKIDGNGDMVIYYNNDIRFYVSDCSDMSTEECEMFMWEVIKGLGGDSL